MNIVAIARLREILLCEVFSGISQDLESPVLPPIAASLDSSY